MAFSGFYLFLEEKMLKQWVFIEPQQEKKLTEKPELSVARKGQLECCNYTSIFSAFLDAFLDSKLLWSLESPKL